MFIPAVRLNLHVLAEQVRAFFGPVERLLFVPYALRDHDVYVCGIVQRGLHAGYVLEVTAAAP